MKMLINETDIDIPYLCVYIFYFRYVPRLIWNLLCLYIVLHSLAVNTYLNIY